MEGNTLDKKKKKILFVIGITCVIAISVSIITIWVSFHPNHTNNGNINSTIQHPWIIALPSHHFRNYRLTVGDILHTGSYYDSWVDVDNVTYLVTNYVHNINWYVVGHPEPARSILSDHNNESNLASGRVRQIKNNTTGYITYYDNDNNDMITIDDEFVINADIIPINSTDGIDFYLIYEGNYTGYSLFEVMERVNLGRYRQHVQLSIEKEFDFYNVTITQINESFFQGKMISNLSFRIYSKITKSTLLWQNINESHNNESSDIIFYDYDNNSVLSITDYFIINDETLNNFVFEIYLESSGMKIGSIE